jgi:hypothetical protein
MLYIACGGEMRAWYVVWVRGAWCVVWVRGAWCVVCGAVRACALRVNACIMLHVCCEFAYCDHDCVCLVLRGMSSAVVLRTCAILRMFLHSTNSFHPLTYTPLTHTLNHFYPIPINKRISFFFSFSQLLSMSSCLLYSHLKFNKI